MNDSSSDLVETFCERNSSRTSSEYHQSSVSNNDYLASNMANNGETIFDSEERESPRLPEDLALDPFHKLNSIRQKNLNRLIIAEININSLRNKFDSLAQMTKDNLIYF